MVYLLVQHTVADYRKWRPIFDENDRMRRASGGGDYQVFRGVNNPNEITILFEWDSQEDAQQFAQSEELKKAMERAGVISRPEARILNEA
jgi:heme-degrading monooxygenase HmoA